MSARHIVAVGSDDGRRLTVSLSKAPVDIPDARRARPLDWDPAKVPPWTAENAVKKHGSELFEKLKSAHGAIDQVLTTALQTQNSTPSFYFHLFADGAEALCWESLYEQGSGFLALSRQWAIARMADTSANYDRPPVVIFDAPLRVMAMLAAHNVPADQEWEQLKAATEAMRKAKRLQLWLLVGDEALHDTIRNDIATNALPGIEVAPMPQRIDEIKIVVNRFAPQLLHVFAHGAIGYGEAALQMSHFGDVGKASGSLNLYISELMGFAAMSNAWLVTLNCCDSGAPTQDMHSMARYLVEHGLPAALGMTEPIAPDDAHELCRAFYTSLFDYLGQQFLAMAGAAQVEIEWSQALHAARSALRDLHSGQPESRRQWTLPVLYVRPEQFYVSPGATKAAAAQPPLTPDDLARIQAVVGFLKSLPPDAPHELRTQALALLSALPSELKPDEFGNFKTPAAPATAVGQAVPTGS